MEEALVETGGFGKFQYLAVLTFQFMITNGSFSLYCMAFFELQPQYLCLVDSEWTSCETEDFCDTNPPVEFKVDWSSSLSLYNWIEEFELYCAPKFEFGLFGSLYFIALVVSSLIFPALSDRIGRRPISCLGVLT